MNGSLREAVAQLVLVVGAAASGGAPSAMGAEPMGAKIEAVLTGTGVHVNRGTDGTGVMAESIWVKSGRVRIDFDGGPSLRGQVLRDGARAWLVQDRHFLPVPGLPLGSMAQLDVEHPCQAWGLSCQRIDDRLIDGHRASGWRFRHAGRKGPNGTDHGSFWIDAEHGVLLAFDAQDLVGQGYRMETLSVEFGVLPDAVFEGPPQVQ